LLKKDYKNALENFLNSEKDRKNGYPQAKSISRKIRDDQWVYRHGRDYLARKKYRESIALFSAFNNTFPEIGTCYALMGDTEKAKKIWKKCIRDSPLRTKKRWQKHTREWKTTRKPLNYGKKQGIKRAKQNVKKIWKKEGRECFNSPVNKWGLSPVFT